MRNIRVSIIIPVYNGADYLDQSIKSALNQTYNNCEIIVVNDGSNDNLKTEKIALSYGKNIKYIKKENGGVASALNRGILEMSGDYFCWLSHDDIYLDIKTEKQVGFHLSFTNPYEFVSYHDYININEDGNEISIRYVEKDDKNISKYLTYKFPINFCSLLIPKNIINVVGNFDENNPIWADHRMLVDIAMKFPFKYMPGFYTKIRKHRKQTTNTDNKMLQHSNDSLIYGLTKYLENNQISKKKQKKLLGKVITYTSHRGYNDAAFFSLRTLKELCIVNYLIYSIIGGINIIYKKIRVWARNSNAIN